jgi:hypothetical protein
MTNIDLTANPPTLRLHWRGIVQIQCPGPHHKSIQMMKHYGCPICHGIEFRDAIVEVDVEVETGSFFIDNKYWGEHFETVDENFKAYRSQEQSDAGELLSHALISKILKAFQDGEDVNGVREII